jgi:DNA-binding NtrC family response regulator
MVLLARHFAAQLGKELRGREATVTDDALALLRAHPWQGNVRELENAIERACILADSTALTAADLGLGTHARARTADSQTEVAADLDLSGTLGEATDRAVRAVERRKITDALRDAGGNKTRAAESLGVSYKTLLTKIKDYAL